MGKKVAFIVCIAPGECSGDLGVYIGPNSKLLFLCQKHGEAYLSGKLIYSGDGRWKEAD